MKIRICFTYKDDCPVMERIRGELKSYQGPHEVEIVTIKGTYLHEQRNFLVSDKYPIPEGLKLPDYDYTIWWDSDIEGSLEDSLYLVSLKKDIVGLPYEVRDKKGYYNAGFIENDFPVYLPFSEKGFKKIDGQGMGACCISKKVFEKVSPLWFLPEQIKTKSGFIFISEDWNFFAKCRKTGFDVWCDFDRPVKHNIKNKGKKMSNQIKMEDLLLQVQNSVISINKNTSGLSEIVSLLVKEIKGRDQIISEKNKEIEDLKSRRNQKTKGRKTE